MFETLVCCSKCIWLHPYTITPAKFPPDLGIQVHLRRGNDATTLCLRLISTSDCCIHPYWTYINCLSHSYAASRAYGCILIPLHRTSWPQIWKVRFTWGVEMMLKHGGWGWYPPQIAGYIHSKDIQSVWDIGLLSQGHMDAPLYHYTNKVSLRYWNLGNLWSENDATMWWLRLTSTSDCFPHLHETYKMCLRYCFAVSRAYGCTIIPLH